MFGIYDLLISLDRQCKKKKLPQQIERSVGGSGRKFNKSSLKLALVRI